MSVLGEDVDDVCLPEYYVVPYDEYGTYTKQYGYSIQH